MGYIIVAVLIIGDIYLYVHGVRPKDSMWRDGKFKWM